MTVAVARYMPLGKGVELLADRRGCLGSSIIEVSKLNRVGVYGFVVAGYAAAEPLVTELLEQEDPVQNLRRNAIGRLDTHGWSARVGEGEPANIDSSFLLTDGEVIWHVGGDFVANEVPRSPGFIAIGSGGEAALGALYAGAEPRRAAEIACLVDAKCGNGIDSALFLPA